MMKAAIFKNPKIIILPLCLFLCIGMLSGCGSKQDNSQTASAAGTETSTQKETARAAETLTEADAAASGQTEEPAASTEAAEGTQTTEPQTGKPRETAGSQTKPEEGAAVLPGSFPVSFTFSSGAGGWRTWMTLFADSTFEGQYSDSEMGDTGEGYPNGSYYIADFTGKFGNIEKLDEFSYSMELEEITLQREPGTSWIEDEVRYVAAEAYGLDGGTEFILYAPETPVEGLSEMFLSWWPGRFEDPASKTLSCYGIYNKAEETGFFSE